MFALSLTLFSPHVFPTSMKILHALGWYFPETLGGTEVYVKALAERQKLIPHDVEVAAVGPGASHVTLTEHDGVAVFRYPTPSDPTRDEAQGRVPARGSEHLRDYLETTRPDIFHVHTLTTGLGLHEIERARQLGIRTVVTNHLGSVGFVCQRGTLMRFGERVCEGIMRETTCAACALHARGLPKALAWSVSFVARGTGALGSRLPGKLGTAFGMNELITYNRKRQARLIELVDRFVVLNRATADVIVNNGGDPKKVTLNYLGLSHRLYERKPSARQRPTKPPVAFGYLGRFHAIKGIHDLARAAVSLPSDRAFTLTLCGPAEDSAGAQMRRIIDDIVAGDARVRVLPAVAPDRVPEVLSSFDALCVPSVAFEGGPTVVSEAHAVGTPVIGTRVGAMPELIEDGVTGALVEPGDWRSLASVLARAASRPAETIDVWRNALPAARTMDDVAADYEALYQQIISDGDA